MTYKEIKKLITYTFLWILLILAIKFFLFTRWVPISGKTFALPTIILYYGFLK